jgi:L-asparaginase
MNKDKRILLIYTGGTIGMVPHPITGVLQPFSLEGLMSKMPELNRLSCQLHLQGFDAPVDSSDMNIERWQQIGRIIEEQYLNYDGFVVLHGSDTMAFTASVLSFMLENLSKPVVLTGSQLPIGVMRSDARENLLTALEIAAAHDEAGDPIVPEVCVYFEYDLYRGNRVYKENAEDFEAFHSPNYPKLAEAGVRLKFKRDHILKRSGIFKFHPELDTRVGIIYLYPGIDEQWIKQQLDMPDYNAFILLSFGSGNAPTNESFLGILKEAILGGKSLFNVSQCRMGSVVQGHYAASEELNEIGVIGGGDILIEAAWAKLMHLQGKGLESKALEKAFVLPICGELSV